MIDDLSLASHVEPIAPGRYTWDVPDHWQHPLMEAFKRLDYVELPGR